jgi:FkbM family methyltransferase
MELKPVEFLVGSNAFGRYCVPAASRHRKAARKILSGEVYEPETIAFMASNCGSGDIVHAGTYFGDFLPALSHALQSEGLIWGFEPSRENFCCASMTIELNRLQNVRLMNAALGTKPSTMPLGVRAADGLALGGGSRLAHEREVGVDYEEATIVVLDDVVPRERRISILQLDVEFFEQEALAGALSVIRRSLPIIILETVPSDEIWFRDNILALGYGFCRKVHRNSIFAPAGTQLTFPT